MEHFGEFLNDVPFLLWCQRPHVTNHREWARVTSWSSSVGRCLQPVRVYHIRKKMCVPRQWVGGGRRGQEKPEAGEADRTIGKGTWIWLSTNCSSGVFLNQDMAVCVPKTVWNRAQQSWVKLKLHVSRPWCQSSFFSPGIVLCCEGRSPH